MLSIRHQTYVKNVRRLLSHLLTLTQPYCTPFTHRVFLQTLSHYSSMRENNISNPLQWRIPTIPSIDPMWWGIPIWRAYIRMSMIDRIFQSCVILLYFLIVSLVTGCATLLHDSLISINGENKHLVSCISVGIVCVTSAKNILPSTEYNASCNIAAVLCEDCTRISGSVLNTLESSYCWVFVFILRYWHWQ